MKIIKAIFGLIFAMLMWLVAFYAYIGAGEMFSYIKFYYATRFNREKNEVTIDPLEKVYGRIDYEEVRKKLMHRAKENLKWGFGIK